MPSKEKDDNALNQLMVQDVYDARTVLMTFLHRLDTRYDEDGNQTSVTTTPSDVTVAPSSTIYKYDDLSRLVSIEAAGASRWEFVYDGLSRLRVSRPFVWDEATGAWVMQSSREEYEKRRIYDGMDVVQERNTANQVTASVTRAGNIGGILARSNASGTSYFAYDPQGNVVALTDSSGVVGSYTYDAWGNVLASSGARAGENPYRFSTKEQLGGLYHFGFRFYNPGTGRWINRDPIRESGGVNLYAAMANNPVDNFDAYGLDLSGFVGTVKALPAAFAEVIFGFHPDSWTGNSNGQPIYQNNDPEHMTGADTSQGMQEIVERGPGMVSDGMNVVVSSCPAGAGRTAAKEGEELLYRSGAWESPGRLSKKAGQAEEQIGIHGVFAHTTNRGYDIPGVPRSEIEKHFPVHNTPNTPTGVDPTHRTIELPKPITNGVASIFNKESPRQAAGYFN